MTISREINDVPTGSGVYMLFSAGLCVYVGSSRHLRRRIRFHEHRAACDGWDWKNVPAEGLREEEQELLDEFQPRLNKATTAVRSTIRAREVRQTRTIAIDPMILRAAERYAAQVARESTNTVIQRAVRELLERNGAWPAKQ